MYILIIHFLLLFHEHVGNKESLKVEGEVGYDDLYDQVLEFYRSKYCRKVMKLVDIGGGRFLY